MVNNQSIKFRDCVGDEQKLSVGVCVTKEAKLMQENEELIWIKSGWSTSKFEDAKTLRDTSAKELRKLGYVVKSKTWDFTDLSRSYRYELEATLPPWEFHSNGGWKKKEGI